MKNIKLLLVIVALVSMLLTACSGLNLSYIAPALAASSGATAPSASASSSQSNALATVEPQIVLDVASLQTAYESVFEKVNPSVVAIVVSSQLTNADFPGFGRRGDDQNDQDSQDQVVPTGEGSGFVWDTAGHIVTNHHVVDGADQINVTFSDGSSFDASLVGSDPNSDLAVIQVSGAPASLLKPITVGDSTQAKVGQMVVAIGNPFGLENTMTTGIVSAIGRSISAGAGRSQNSLNNATPFFSIPDVIQTDAPINPGNSGGVLVDMSGALIGVPSQIESTSGSNSGIGFAIPSTIVSKVVPQLIANGKAERSYLGISGGAITSSAISRLNLAAGQKGVLVAAVVAGGPAEKAGLKPATLDESGVPTAAGDIITGIDGKSVTRFEDLISYLYNNTQPGQTVTLDILRDGKQIQVKVTLGVQPTN